MSVNLSEFDIILVNSSGGKDSQTMLRKICRMAKAQGVLNRVTVVHADLGRMEWTGTKELAEKQAEHYGVPFVAIARPQGDLLDHIESHGKFPNSSNRFCTSDHKRGQVRKVMTALVRDVKREQGLRRPVRLLNCMGMRAEESNFRKKMPAFKYDENASGKGTVRQVWNWLPIHEWKETEVWADIHASGVPYHPAYDLGMPRLSCCFCVLASKSALVLAAQHNPELAEQYRQVEVKIGHRFTDKLSMAQIITEAKSKPTLTAVENWAA